MSGADQSNNDVSEADAAGNAWPQAHVDLAVRCWREGETASQIAARLKISRNAVCGFAFRHRDLMPPRGMGRVTSNGPAAGGEGREARTGAALKARPSRAVAPRGGVFKQKARPVERPAMPVSIFDGQKPGARADLSRFQVPGREAVAFADLDAGQCRFPLAAFDAAAGPDMPCCGAAVHAGSWCGDHYAVVFARRA